MSLPDNFIEQYKKMYLDKNEPQFNRDFAKQQLLNNNIELPVEQKIIIQQELKPIVQSKTIITYNNPPEQSESIEQEKSSWEIRHPLNIAPDRSENFSYVIRFRITKSQNNFLKRMVKKNHRMLGSYLRNLIDRESIKLGYKKELDIPETIEDEE